MMCTRDKGWGDHYGGRSKVKMGDGGLREIHGDDCMSTLHGVSFDKYCSPQQIGCMNHHPVATGAHTKIANKQWTALHLNKWLVSW